jgi:hypothetical protein
MKKKSKTTCEGIYQNHTKASGDYDYHVPRLMSEYAMNLKMVLALQQMGQGKTGAGILGGMFSIIPEGLKNQWTELEEAIAQYQIALGTTILEENVKKEQLLSEVDKFDRYLFCVSIDAAWNTRGSGKSYNSDSGHHITVGNRTGLVVALHYMSKRCVKCELASKAGVVNVHDPNVCSRNYLGSSKGMEADGALVGCLHLHKNHNVVYEIIVMDDDSSTENILKWNFKEAFDKELIASIPKTPSGGKKVDNGKLPLTHPPITRLADHNHRNRCMAGKIYKLARGSKKKSLCSTADAERLKRNLTYALHEYKTHDFVTFKKMMWNVLYHHFDIHDTCGDWCRSVQYKDNPEELKKLHYRDKVTDDWLYEQLEEIWELYCTDESLREVHHSYHTNKCESMNKFITKFVDKSLHLCRTIVGKARTYVAVGIDSVGYEEYYRRLFELIDLDYDDDIMGTHHRRLDAKKVWKKRYDKQPHVRRREAMVRALKIRENIRKEYVDKKAGKSYGSGMNDPSQKASEESDDVKKPPKPKKPPCAHCGLKGHSTTRSKKCLLTTYVEKKKEGKFRLANVHLPKYPYFAHANGRY